MSFKFNFAGDDLEEPKTNSGSHASPEKVAPVLSSTQAEEVLIDWSLEKPTHDETEMVALHDGCHLRIVSSHIVEEAIKAETRTSSDISKALQVNSDLVPDVYEGGLKVWECSVDLTNYLSSLDIAWRGLRVLELGCGAGLPGLLAYTQGADVHFQDYNEEVVRLITSQNVRLNQEGADETAAECTAPERCRFFSGDWASLPGVLQGGDQCSEHHKYDIILTSETIYSVASYGKLHDVMRDLLKPDGTIYLAAKTYYFGVGGGTRDFEDFLDGQKVFRHTICKEITGGVQREILKLTLKDAS